LESNDVGKTNGGLIIVDRVAVAGRGGGIRKQNEYSESEERNRCRSNPACNWIMEKDLYTRWLNRSRAVAINSQPCVTTSVGRV
jgi:hypothetical protein